MKAEGLNVELKSMGWHLFEKSNLILERQERVLGAAEGEYEFAAIRGALIKRLLDTTISQENPSVPDRKPSHVSDVTRSTKLMRVTQRKIQTPRRKSRVKKAAFERELDELASVVEELEDTLGVQDVEDLRELSESMFGLATIRETRKVEGENEESRLSAFLVCFLSRSFRFKTEREPSNPLGTKK